MKKQWIKHPLILDGSQVNLLPLEKEHLVDLYKIGSDEKIWEHIPTDCYNRSTFLKAYKFALSERKKGNQYPFIIYHKEHKQIIGSTRLFEIYPKDRKLEIGWTWILPEYWSSGINLECKLILLTYCFEHLKTLRVQLKTDEKNIRSRKAIEKIGAKFEGIFRKDRIRDNGLSRNAAYYSIIDDEWNALKEKLMEKVGSQNQT